MKVFNDGTGNALYVAGRFTSAGGVPANNVARWNGTSWSSLGTGSANGVINTVHALTVFDDGLGGGPALYAGGLFTTAGGVTANRIARWNGTSWSGLGTGSANGVGSTVRALTVFDDGLGGGEALYAGGDFTSAAGGTVQANRIARWNGASWSSLGTGAANGVGGVSSPTVRALTVFDDGSGGGEALYAGGDFTSAAGGTVQANRIARWNGTSWSSLGTGSANGVNDLVRALTVFDDGLGGGKALYAGGRFTSAGGLSTSRIARWDGAGWSAFASGMALSGSPFSSGMLPEVDVLVSFPEGFLPRLFVGGNFTSAGGVASIGIAKWGCVPLTTDGPPPSRPAVAAALRRPSAAPSAPLDRILRKGESLVLGAESLRFGTLTALAGSTIRVEHPEASLTVSNLIIEDGAVFAWLAGTIEVDGGAWLHPYELAIGCAGEARLVLANDAYLRAPLVGICGSGSLVGGGSVDAPTVNAGTVGGEAGGLRIIGSYRHEPSGAVAAGFAEFDADPLPDLHPCTTVDGLAAADGLEAEGVVPGRVDVDRDGDLDLIQRVRLGTGSVALLWLDRGDGHLGSPILCGSELDAHLVEIGDVDGDGSLDLSIASDRGPACVAFGGGKVTVVQ
jgi:hypothetical protein